MAQLEAVLSRGFDAVVADLATRAATAPVANAEQRWSKPEITGRLDTLRMLLRRADGWVQLASVSVLSSLHSPVAAASARTAGHMTAYQLS